MIKKMIRIYFFEWKFFRACKRCTKKILSKKIKKMKIIFIAEIGINHNGNLNIAKEMIDISKEAGADIVKFQKRDIDTVYSKEILDTPRESPWGTTTREQKYGLEL